MNKPKLLIVDDDLVNMSETMKFYLETKGIEAYFAGNGKDAFAYLEKQRPDLVLLDIRLEDEEDGLTVLKKMKEKDKSLRIYVITAYADTYLDEACKLGANRYIQKPLDAEKIETIICKALGVK